MSSAVLQNSDVAVMSLGRVRIEVPADPSSIEEYIAQWQGVHFFGGDTLGRIPKITMKSGDYSLVQVMGDFNSWGELRARTNMQRLKPAPWELLCPLMQNELFIALGVCSGVAVDNRIVFLSRQGAISLVDAEDELRRMAHLFTHHDPTSRVPDQRFGALFYI